MRDEYHHQTQRRRLLEQIRERGIRDDRVLRAMYAIPRHLFLDSTFEQHAYEDKPFSIGAGQTISQPYTVARQTELLQVEKRHHVLEIGTGSGYQACVLAQLGARVFTVERQRELYQRTKILLPRLGFPQIRTYYRDGSMGLPELAPFHRILVTAGATEVPPALPEQLKIGGILVIPVGESSQRMLRITRREDGFTTEDFGAFAFVPFLGGRE